MLLFVLADFVRVLWVVIGVDLLVASVCFACLFAGFCCFGVDVGFGVVGWWLFTSGVIADGWIWCDMGLRFGLWFI